MMNIRFTRVDNGEVAPFNQVIESLNADVPVETLGFIVGMVGASIAMHTCKTDRETAEAFIGKCGDKLPMPEEEIRRLFYEEYTAEVWC